MQLDVSAPAVSRGARSIRTQGVKGAFRGRVVDDRAGGIRQDDVELVVNTWLSRIPGANGKVDVTKLVGPGRATDLPGAGGLVGRRVRTVAAIIPKKVPRNAGPVNVQAGAVIDVLQVAPGRRAVLAPASDAKVGLGTVVHDPAAAGQKVAWGQRIPGLCVWRGGGPDCEHGRKYHKRPTRETACQFTDSFRSSIHLCILLSKCGSLVVKLRDTRGRGCNYDVGNAGNNDMQGVHCGAAGG